MTYERRTPPNPDLGSGPLHGSARQRTVRAGAGNNLDLIGEADLIGRRLGHHAIGAGHLLLAAVRAGDRVSDEACLATGLDPAQLHRALAGSRPPASPGANRALEVVIGAGRAEAAYWGRSKMRVSDVLAALVRAAAEPWIWAALAEAASADPTAVPRTVGRVLEAVDVEPVKLLHAIAEETADTSTASGADPSAVDRYLAALATGDGFTMAAALIASEPHSPAFAYALHQVALGLAHPDGRVPGPLDPRPSDTATVALVDRSPNVLAPAPEYGDFALDNESGRLCSFTIDDSDPSSRLIVPGPTVEHQGVRAKLISAYQTHLTGQLHAVVELTDLAPNTRPELVATRAHYQPPGPATPHHLWVLGAPRLGATPTTVVLGSFVPAQLGGLALVDLLGGILHIEVPIPIR